MFPVSIRVGTFTGKKVPGEGLTAELLRKNGIKCSARINWMNWSKSWRVSAWNERTIKATFCVLMG